MNRRSFMGAGAALFASLVLATFAEDKTGSQDAAWLLQTNLLERASAPKGKSGLPKVLVLGDSISLGYTPFVKEKLAGIAEVSRPACNCGPSEFYLKSMRDWVGTNRWDVIHVNFGIWDNHYLKGPADGMGLFWGREITNAIPPIAKGTAIRDLGFRIRTPIKDYERNLRTILAFLKTRADNVVFGLTTPLKGWESDDRCGRIRVYNELAAEVCREMDVGVSDLYAVAERNLDKQTDGCHFSAEGYDRLADAVVESIRRYVAEEAPTVVNIVNFVRGCEPRDPTTDLVTPLREEIALNTRHHLRNTILLQYDALLRDDLVSVARSAEPELTEYGVWIEMCRQLVEKVGLVWRGRKGWDWDWYINPGFLMAYTQEERGRLLDEVFRLFRERFGRWPESMGSWLLDAWSMDYVQRKYGVKAFCICREQDNTDAYGLRGGFFNGGYYPSKRNMLSAAVDPANAVRAPCFKMLTPDPIYNYSESLKTRLGNGPASVYTLEPVWKGGHTREIVDWYFKTYTGPGRLGLSYMQVGQENSFGWEMIGRGLPYQIERIAALRDAGKVRVEQLRETGEAFIGKYPVTPPQAQVALTDWNGTGNQSAWYNSRRYRANLVNENGKLYLRDIHVMKDDFEEPFLTRVCTGWQAEYFTPPVVDLYLANRKEARGPIRFDGVCKGLSVLSSRQGRLVIRAERDTGDIVFRFDEASFEVEGAELAGFAPGRHELTFRGYRYAVLVEALPRGVRMRFDSP